MKNIIAAILGLLLIPLALSQQQKGGDDVVAQIMVQLFRQYNDQFLCLPETFTPDSLRHTVDENLKGMNINDRSEQNINRIVSVVYTTFPCPFSSSRPELRPALADDFVGHWLVPESSIHLRFGKKSPQWKSQPGMPSIRCEGVSLYPDGEARAAQILGSVSCPTLKDMEAFAKAPRVVTWRLLRDGRLQTVHSAPPGESEEWDIFVVEKPFVAAKVRFGQGDLIAYLRYQKNNNLNVSTVFRHLQRLQ